MKTFAQVAASGLVAAHERLQPFLGSGVDHEVWLFSVAEIDPAAASILRVEGLRPEPRPLSDGNAWTA